MKYQSLFMALKTNQCLRRVCGWFEWLLLPKQVSFKTHCPIFIICTYLCPSDRRATWGHHRQVAPEHCSSRLTHSIQWQCEYCRALAKWLKHFDKTVDKKRLAWYAICNSRTVILNIHLPDSKHPKCQTCPNWTNEHFFFRSRNCL